MNHKIRVATAAILAPIMAVTGYRISKAHRQNETLLYRLCFTVLANHIADEISNAYNNWFIDSIALQCYQLKQFY